MKLIVLTILSLGSIWGLRVSKGPDCTCVMFYQCSDKEELITNGENLLDPRDGFCPGTFEVCCKKPAPTTPQKPKSPHGCGQFSHEDSWSAFLLYRQRPKFAPTYLCGVSLIHDNIALTAAHCLEKQGVYEVGTKSQSTSITKVVIHPNYKPEALHYDIAVLILKKPLANVRIPCILPSDVVLEKAHCLTTKIIGEDNPKTSVIELAVINEKKCEHMLRTTRLGVHFQLHSSFVCAKTLSKENNCEGDGGSPLICAVPGVKGRYHQIGIVSWGIGCGKELPGVYVHLPFLREWVDEVVTGNGFDLTSYRL